MKKFSSILKSLQFFYYNHVGYRYQDKLSLLLEEKQYSKIFNMLNSSSLNKRDWTNFSSNLVQSYVKDFDKIDKDDLVEALLNAQGEINYINSDYNGWLGLLIEKQSEKQDKNYLEYKSIYQSLISSNKISHKEKSALELTFLRVSLEKDEFNSFNTKSNINFSSALSDVSAIIDNGFIFHNKLSSFRALLWILSNNIITQHLAPKKIKKCLESFSCLNSLAKKVIFKTLINKKQETIIFNLFNHGIDLDWLIDFDGNGQKEVCSLKILQELKLSEFLLSSNDWNIVAVNPKTGENLLHMMCGSCLLDEVTIGYLEDKINKLDSESSKKILNHKNLDNLSPLTQALLLQDEQMINFLVAQGATSNNENLQQALDFINQCLNGENIDLLIQYLPDITIDKNFWFELRSMWLSEKLNDKLKKELAQKSASSRSVKI